MKYASLNINFDSIRECLKLSGYGLNSNMRDIAFFDVMDRFLEISDEYGFKFSIFVIGKDLERKENYNYLFWLRFYMQIRFREMQVDITEHQVTHELKEAEQVWRSSGPQAALEYVSRRTAAMLEKQMGIYRSLRTQGGKSLLTGGDTPAIIL